MELGFVFGGHKCGTSPLVALLNCHPEVLCLYEARLSSPVPTKSGRRLIESHPDWRSCFGVGETPTAGYRRLAELLDGRYRYLFDKMPGVSSRIFSELSGDKTIYIVRDLRTWLGNGVIEHFYSSSQNLVPIAVDYVAMLIESFRHPMLRIRMKDLITPKSAVPERVCNYLGLPPEPRMLRWWESTNGVPGDPLKDAMVWSAKHPSSRMKPQRQDTRVVPSNHPFWAEIMPVFTSYFSNMEQTVSRPRMGDDLALVQSLRDKYVLPYPEAFSERHTERLGQDPSMTSRVSRRLAALFGR